MKISAASLLVASSVISSVAIADNVISPSSPAPSWRPVLSLGGGVAISSNVGQSKTFPVINPITDSFYAYTNNQATQTRLLFDSMLGVEWSIHPLWDLQLGLGFSQTESFRPTGILVQGPDTSSADQYSYSYDVSTSQLLAEGKLLYTYRDRFHPYVLAGLGVAYNNADTYGTNVPPFLTFTRQYSGNTQTSFSYQLGLGVDMDISHHLRFGVGYRFADVGEVKLGDAIINATPAYGTLTQSHLYINEVLAQMTWLF